MNKAKNRVLHIITGLNNGGAEAVLHNLCSIDNTNLHTVISLMDGGKYGPLLERAGVEVYHLNMPQGRITLGGLIKLWRLLSQCKPDVVQTWMYHADLIGGVLARLALVRNVCWGIHHGSLEFGNTRRSTILIARICAWLSQWVPRRIICCATKAAEIHRTLGYVPEKFVVIPNGYNLKQFWPDADARQCLRNKWGVAFGMPLLGMVGRFHPTKDYANLIIALGTLKQGGLDFRCVLVGNGLDEDNIELMGWLKIHNVRDRVLLLGSRSDIPAVMSALDVHILSSLGEAFPNVLAEAMACGTPCISTDVGDAALIVGDTGWLVPPQNPNALSCAIDTALTAWLQKPNWQERRFASRSRIMEYFSIEKMIDSYKTVWMSSA